MNFKGHVIITSSIAVASIATVKYFYPNSQIDRLCYAGAAMVFGGMFPDVDTHSHPSKIYAFLSLIALIVFTVIKFPWFGVAIVAPYLLAKMSKHRGWTHSTIFPILCITLSIVLTERSYAFIGGSQWIIWWFGVGLLIHILIDLISTRMKRSKTLKLK